MVVRHLNGKVIVFDCDGVIAKNNGGNYAEALPYEFTIEQINTAYDMGYYIKIATARYGDREKGNLTKIYQRGFRELQDWMTKYGVKYDELIMGKPSGDLYVDDKAVHIDSERLHSSWEHFWERVDDLRYVDKYNQKKELDSEGDKLKDIH